MIAYFEVIKIIYRNIKELECAQYIMLDKKQTPNIHILVFKAIKIYVDICKNIYTTKMWKEHRNCCQTWCLGLGISYNTCINLSIIMKIAYARRGEN